MGRFAFLVKLKCLKCPHVSSVQTTASKGLKGFYSVHTGFMHTCCKLCVHVRIYRTNKKCEVKYCPVCLRLGSGLPALRPRESRRGLRDHHCNLPTGQRRVCCCQVPQKPMWVMKPTVTIQTVTTICWFQWHDIYSLKNIRLNVLWFCFKQTVITRSACLCQAVRWWNRTLSSTSSAVRRTSATPLTDLPLLYISMTHKTAFNITEYTWI